MLTRFDPCGPLSKGFCYEHEGLMGAARLMADKHLLEVLVLNGNDELVGAYVLTQHGIQFRTVPLLTLDKPRAV
jgi:hypothetical protein